MLDEAPADALEDLDEAFSAHLVFPEPGNPRRFRFSHIIVRDALYESIPNSRRVRLHARTAEALEHILGTVASNHASELAFHYYEARTVTGPDGLLRYGLLAGEQAIARNAFEEALAHFRRALHARPPSPTDETAALLHLGCFTAGAALAGHFEFHDEILDSASESFDYFLANRVWDKAVRIIKTPVPAPTPETIRARMDMATRLLAAVPLDTKEAAQASTVHGELLCYVGSLEEAEGSFAMALAHAERQEDGWLLMETLRVKVRSETFHWQNRLDQSYRVIHLARSLGDPIAELEGVHFATADLVMSGRARTALSLGTAALADKAAGLAPFWQASVLGMMVAAAHLLGDWDTGREHGDRALSAQPDHVVPLCGRSLLEFESGCYENGWHFWRQTVDLMNAAPRAPVIERAWVGAAAAVAGRILSEPSLQEFAAETTAPLLGGYGTTVFEQFACIGMAVAAVERYDAATASELYEYFARVQGIDCRQSLGPSVMSSQRMYGLLCVTMGRIDEAYAHFQNSIEWCRMTGYKPELAWSLHDYGEALAHMNRPEDWAVAAALLQESRDIAQPLGMRHIVERVDRLLGMRSAGSVEGLTPRQVEVLRLIAAGHSNEEIARRLVVSVHTVANHVRSILDKTGSSNRTGAAAYAIHHGLTAD